MYTKKITWSDGTHFSAYVIARSVYKKLNQQQSFPVVTSVEEACAVVAAVNSVMSAAAAELPQEWYKNQEIYPDAVEIAKALQDLGKKDKKGKQKYPLLEKLAAKLYSNIQRLYNNPDGLTKNVSRGKMPLVQGIAMLRKHKDIHETDSSFHSYGKEGKVYLIANDVRTCGLDIAIMHFQRHIQQAVQQKNSARTFNDGLRLGCILLDSKYRGTVGGIMTKKKDRKRSDISGDPINNIFELVLTECFTNAEYVATPPSPQYYDAFPEDEKSKWDPNHYSNFEHERDASWLRTTWEEYVRPKYKKALDKWNKDTGGGDGNPTSFIDFCAGDRWLVWLFCKDLEANILLANLACGRMPTHLQVESGFEDMSQMTETAKLDDELSSAKKHRKKVGNTLDRIVTYMNNKEEPEKIDR